MLSEEPNILISKWFNVKMMRAVLVRVTWYGRLPLSKITCLQQDLIHLHYCK